MADNESIGGIAVQIVGNYAPLLEDIQQATAAASKGGAEIADALTAGAAGADALSSSVTAAALGLGSFESQIEALVSSGSTLAEALAAVQAGTTAMASGVEEAGAAAAQAAEQLNLFDEAISVPYGDAAGQLNMFATELEPIPPAAKAAAEAETELANATEHAGESAHHAAGGLGEFGEKLIAFGEAFIVIEGLKELGAEALHAADNITRASISLTALTEDGKKAKETIEAIEKLGIRDGLSLPALLQASTRMTNLLGAGAPVPELLAKIADGAAVMGKDIGAAADSFDRLATMGTLGARQLMPLGLNLEQIATAMNHVSGSSEATARNVASMFKEMDQSERVEVLSAALDRLGGIAQKTAENTFGGQWQILANQWEQVMRNVGEALLPVITSLTDLMKVDILPWLKDITESFNRLPAPVRETVVVVGLLAAAVVPVALAIGGLGVALSAAGSAIAPVGAALVALGAGLTGAGASYTAMLATGIASAAVWVGLAAALAEVVVAYHSMAKAEDLAAKSQSDAARSLAVYETALRQHGVAIDALSQAYHSGRITTEEYIAGLGKLRDEYLKTHPVVQEHAAATGAVLNVSEALRIKMGALADTVASTRDKLAKVTDAYNNHKASAQDVAAAYDKWQGATGALKAAQDALLPVVTNVHHATREFVDIFARDFPDAVKASTNAAEALNVKIGQQSQDIASAQKFLDFLIERWNKFHDNAGDVIKAFDALSAAQARLNKELGEFPDGAKILKEWEKNAGAAARAIALILPPLAAAPPLVRTLGIDLFDLGLKARNAAGEITTKLLAAFEDLAAKQTPTLEEAHLAWAKVQQDVNRLAKYDLPEALKVYGEYESLLRRIGASEGELLGVRKEYLSLEIKIAEQTGASATSQIIGLQNVKIAQQALYDQTHLMGDLYVGVTNDILHGFDELGKSVADAIFDSKNLGDAFIEVGKKVGKAILEDIVGTYMKALKNAILGVNTDVNGLSSSFVKLGQTVAKVFGGGGGAIGPEGVVEGKDMLNHGSLADESGEVTGGIDKIKGILGGGGAGGGMGGALGAIDAITGIGTLISSIFGNFQMARLETTMNAVEHNTRFLEIIFQKYAEQDEWQRHHEVLESLGNIFTRLGELAGGLVDALVETFTNGGTPAVPHMSEGGPVLGDGLRYLHDGEWVLPRAEVPQMEALSAPATARTASVSVNAGNNTFHIYEAANPRETARQVAEMLKILSPRHAAFAQ